MAGRIAIFVLALAGARLGVQAARVFEQKQESEGNGNVCLQSVAGFSSVTFTCNLHGFAAMRQCTKKMQSYTSQGYISCQDLGCECPKDHFCYRKPHLNTSPFCLQAASAESLTAKGTKLLSSGEKEYVQSTGCEFESFGFSTKHLTDTAGCVGDLVADIRDAPEPESLLQDNATESFMDLSETIAVADEEAVGSEGNGNKCLGIVESYNTASFTCNLHGFAMMRQCTKKMSEYTSQGYISCQDLGCPCDKDYFCYRRPNLGRTFCLSQSEALTAKGKGLYESSKLPGKELFESTDCKFESFGFSTRHFTDTAGCEKGPGGEDVVTAEQL